MTPTNILNSLCFLAILCNSSLELSPAVSSFLVAFIVLVFSLHSVKFGIVMYNDHFIDKALRNEHMKSVLAEIIAQKPRFQSMPIKKNWYELDAFQIFFYLWSVPLLYLKVQLAGFLALILIFDFVSKLIQSNGRGKIKEAMSL